MEKGSLRLRWFLVACLLAFSAAWAIAESDECPECHLFESDDPPISLRGICLELWEGWGYEWCQDGHGGAYCNLPHLPCPAIVIDPWDP